MGDRGPTPKRSDQRRRTNAPVVPVTKAPVVDVVVPLKSDPGWHRVARVWFDSLETSGQSQFYSDSDWGTAYFIADAMSRELMPQPVTLGRGDDAVTVMVELPPKGASLAAWLKGMSMLLATEGDRRRVSLELQRSKPDGEGGGDVAWIDDARRRLNGAS